MDDGVAEIVQVYNPEMVPALFKAARARPAV
jgi:hypothetical protein